MESNAKDKPGESAEMKPEKPKPQIGKIKICDVPRPFLIFNVQATIWTRWKIF